MIEPIVVKGKFNEALVYAKAVEATCEDKIRQYLDQEIFAGTKVRIMPDVHIGKGCVVGFTATCNEVIVPALIGVDIGCGVCACNLGRGNMRFDKLDAFIRKNIPAGMDIRSSLHEKLADVTAFTGGDSNQFKQQLRELCKQLERSPERIFASLGTLGGGNHFIEIDSDENHNRWLLIHSGSRVLGTWTAEYHDVYALRETPESSPLKYISGDSAENYRNDLVIVQQYAKINRALMAATIAEDFFKIDIHETEYRDSMHNYLDFSDSLIRKGAISAHKDEKVVIPFSMADGAILGRGKANEKWNNSAPHGAGRKISRSQARQGLSLDEYRKQMKNVWSSTVCKETLDESPMAYKRPRDILEYLEDTVEIEQRLMPLYNFKTVE
ncbi:RNA-splicing ligase RtcB [Spirochaetia bacterium]|nr:RNA-splicing ligase RtcB [Spirochaetia bacterium]